jgi:kynureninase
MNDTAKQEGVRFQNTIACARQLDEQDPLKQFREKFYIPRHHDKDCVYFTGNSLGLQPRSVREYIGQELDDWATLGVEGHFKGRHPWLSYHERFPDQLSKIAGALPAEVVVMNQLTVNLHLLLTTFYRPTKKRYKIICEAKAFPSDQYALESQVSLHGFQPLEAIVEVGTREGEANISTADIIDSINRHKDEVALVIFGGVNYYTGQVLDMKRITAAAHAVHAVAGFDLAHAIGNIELKLHDWEVDFACWCSYKYLNSGPGGVGGVFIHEKHAANRSLPRLGGWWGHDKESRFLMKPGFKPMPGAEGWQLSNAPILSMAAHKASLDIFEEAGMEALIAKSKRLTGFLFFVLDDMNKKFERKVIEVITPENNEEHGCQVSLLMLESGRQVFNELLAQGVIADWREPNVIRIAPVPLYNTFEEVWLFGNIIESILQ